MAKIEAPNANYTGTGVGGVTFTKGVGFTDDDALIERFERKGYTVDLSDSTPASKGDSIAYAQKLAAGDDTNAIFESVDGDPIRASVALMFENGRVDPRPEVVQRLQEIGDSTPEGLQSTARAGIFLGGARGSTETAVPGVPASVGPSATDSDAGSGDDSDGYDDWTVEELKAEASERDIKDRSGMNKGELVDALEESDKRS